MTDEKMIQEFRRVMREEAEAVLRAAEYISDGAVVEVVRLLSACKGRVVVSGCGTSGVAARKIVHELCCVGCPASFLSPGGCRHGGMGRAARGGRSHSRLQRRQHAGARHAHSRLQGHRVTLLAVTENAQSAIATAAMQCCCCIRPRSRTRSTCWRRRPSFRLLLRLTPCVSA